jgi:hypothetical protein
MLKSNALLLLVLAMGCKKEGPPTPAMPTQAVPTQAGQTQATPTDEDIARCDRIAAKYVSHFADPGNPGTTRQHFLAKCVLGPEKAYTEHGAEWVTCMDHAVSAGAMANCQKVLDHRLETDELRRAEALPAEAEPAPAEAEPLEPR